VVGPSEGWAAIALGKAHILVPDPKAFPKGFPFPREGKGGLELKWGLPAWGAVRRELLGALEAQKVASEELHRGLEVREPPATLALAPPPVRDFNRTTRDQGFELHDPGGKGEHEPCARAFVLAHLPSQGG
jgi:hypothetical protein